MEPKSTTKYQAIPISEPSPAESPLKKPSTKTPPTTTTTTTTTKSSHGLESRCINLLPALGFAFMTYNAAEALYKARDDIKTVAFVVSAYAELLLLFWCLRKFEKIPERSSPQKDRLKIAIWTLATALNVSFSYRVTTILDSTVMLVFVWTIAAITTVGGFYGLFILPDVETSHKDRTTATAVATDEV